MKNCNDTEEKGGGAALVFHQPSPPLASRVTCIRTCAPALLPGVEASCRSPAAAQLGWGAGAGLGQRPPVVLAAALQPVFAAAAGQLPALG
jgi:hypothetical protein